MATYASEAIAMPVAGNDPCGADLRWDADFMALDQALGTATAQNDAEGVVEGQTAAVDTAAIFRGIRNQVLKINARTKDIRVLAVHAESEWRTGGLPAFAGAMAEMVAAVEAWPDPATGIHPRADEEDGDLGERAAALGKLLNRVRALAETVGWGDNVSLADQIETGTALGAVFDHWTERLEAAFGDDLPSPSDAWNALGRLTSGARQAGEEGAAAGDGGAGAPTARPISGDAWDAIERATEMMATQDRHSPALPILRLLASWRSVGIMEISEQMRVSGLGLEQLLDSVKKQLQQN